MSGILRKKEKILDTIHTQGERHMKNGDMQPQVKEPPGAGKGAGIEPLSEAFKGNMTLLIS